MNDETHVKTVEETEEIARAWERLTDGHGGVVVAPMNLSPSTDTPSPGGPPPRFVDERDQPRSPSISDVLAKLQEIEEKLDVLVDEVSSQRART